MPCHVSDEERRYYSNLSNTADLMRLYLEICYNKNRNSIIVDDFSQFAKFIDVSEMTKHMCESCKGRKNTAIQKLSLEAQIWWRDHQEKDLAKGIKNEKKNHSK